VRAEACRGGYWHHLEDHDGLVGAMNMMRWRDLVKMGAAILRESDLLFQHDDLVSRSQQACGILAFSKGRCVSEPQREAV
jgi:hypothetical protein